MKICPFCGIRVASEFDNCPNCGKDISGVKNVTEHPKDKIDTKHKSFADQQAEKESRAKVNELLNRYASTPSKSQNQVPPFIKSVDSVNKPINSQIHPESPSEQEKAKQALLAKQKRLSVVITVIFFAVFIAIVLITMFLGH